MKAYVLISIRTGQLTDALRQIKRVEGISEANMTFGPYDAVAIVHAADIKALGKILSMDIQPIPGVLETITCLAVED